MNSGKFFSHVFKFAAICILVIGIYAAIEVYDVDFSGTEIYVAQDVATPIPVGQSVNNKNEAAILFTGDVMLGRYVETLMNEKGQSYPFDALDTLFVAPDLTVINLEGPIVQRHVQTPIKEFGFSFSSSTATLLKSQGIDVASIANNHTGDKGSAGYSDTVRFLSDVSIDTVGHPHDNSQEYVLRKKVNGQDIVFVAFNYTNPSFKTAEAKNLVTTLKKEEGTFIIAMIHGGNEYELTSSSAQKTFYRSLVDAGVDAVIAHHPHVVQEVESYNGKPIFYSLGNFIFDQYFSADVQKGLVVRLILSDSQAYYELVPVNINRSQPKVMSDEYKKTFLAELAKRSPTISTLSDGFVEVLR